MFSYILVPFFFFYLIRIKAMCNDALTLSLVQRTIEVSSLLIIKSQIKLKKKREALVFLLDLLSIVVLPWRVSLSFNKNLELWIANFLE